MTDQLRPCLIPGNSDIAGVGVRASVYTQACLAVLNLAYLMHILTYDSEKEETGPSDAVEPQATPLMASAPASSSASNIHILRASTPPSHSSSSPPLPTSDASELDADNPLPAFLETQASYISLSKSLERSLFMVGFAIILSSVIELKTSSVGLTPYHTLIVLNMSLINNWAGFCLLMLRGGFRTSGKKGWKEQLFVTKESLRSSFWCLLHSTAVCGLGIYFWARPGAFLKYVEDADGPCQPQTYYYVLTSIPISHPSLRIASLVFYGISIIPVWGLYFQALIPGFALLFAMFAALLALFAGMIVAIIFGAIWFALIKPVFGFLLRPIIDTSFVEDLVDKLYPTWEATRDGTKRLFTRTRQGLKSFIVGPTSALPLTSLAGIFFAIPIIYTIISTEQIIRINADFVDQASETEWTYGQTLALFSALVAVGMYGGEWGKTLREGMRERRARVERGTGQEKAAEGGSLP
jgi:hypothetical protein